MKKIVMSAILVALVATGALVLTGCGKGEQTGAGAQVEESSQQYACAMKCEGDKTYPNPGDCPVCEMPLAKV